MKKLLGFAMLIVLVGIPIFMAFQAVPPTPAKLGLWAIGAVSLMLVTVLWGVFESLSAPGSTWSLAMALSEQDVVKDSTGAPIVNPATQKPEVQTASSSSRIIAFIGSLVIASVFLGVGYYIVYGLFNNVAIKDKISEIWPYFVAGATLFAPYAVNQLKELAK